MAHAYYPHISKAKDTAVSSTLPFDTLAHGVITGVSDGISTTRCIDTLRVDYNRRW